MSFFAGFSIGVGSCRCFAGGDDEIRQLRILRRSEATARLKTSTDEEQLRVVSLLGDGERRRLAGGESRRVAELVGKVHSAAESSDEVEGERRFRVDLCEFAGLHGDACGDRRGEIDFSELPVLAPD